MWRNIIAQASYQVGILVSIQCNGAAILGTNLEVAKSLVFNSYVLCQVFNLFNCRKLEKKNVFKGIHRNCWFCVAVGAILELQAVFIEIEHIVGGSERLNGGQWGICFLIGMAPWVIDWATKMGIRFHHRLDWTQSAIWHQFDPFGSSSINNNNNIIIFRVIPPFILVKTIYTYI